MADVTMSDRDVQDLGAFRHLASSPGELAKKFKEFEDEGAKYREKVRDLTEKAKAVPPEGAVVLTGDEATAFAAWKALELKPEDVAKLKTERDDLKGKVEQRDRQDSIAAVAKAMKWPDETVHTLLDMSSLNGAAFELKKEKVKDAAGKEEEVDVPYVTLVGEGQKQQKFADFAASAPQLKGIRTDAATTAQDTSGRVVQEQRGNPGKEVVGGGIDAMIASMQKAATAPNPLNPAKAA